VAVASKLLMSEARKYSNSSNLFAALSLSYPLLSFLPLGSSFSPRPRLLFALACV
jgi:hypothetical protein